jgi:MFS family permease
MPGVSALQWVVGAYALTFAGAMLACGMIGDEFGRKKVMLAGAGVFCAGSVLKATIASPA